MQIPTLRGVTVASCQSQTDRKNGFSCSCHTCILFPRVRLDIRQGDVRVSVRPRLLSTQGSVALPFFVRDAQHPTLRGFPCPQPFSCPVPAGAPGASRCPFSFSSSSVPAKRPPRKRSKSCHCRSSAAACGGCCPATSWSWRWHNGYLPHDPHGVLV